jgi:hypothetical protein
MEMNMKTNECYELYHKMVLNKSKHPYSIGLYKLEESLSLFKMIDDEIGRIASYGKKGCRVNLRHCTSDDRFEYLAKLPLLIAEVLGSGVYPAIEGLLGDGLTQKQVNKIKQESRGDIETLVKRCDETNQKIKRNPKFIERKIASWDYEPTRLTLRAITIVEDILYGVEMALRIDDGVSFTDILIAFEKKIQQDLHRSPFN